MIDYQGKLRFIDLGMLSPIGNSFSPFGSPYFFSFRKILTYQNKQGDEFFGEIANAPLNDVGEFEIGALVMSLYLMENMTNSDIVFNTDDERNSDFIT